MSALPSTFSAEKAAEIIDDDIMQQALSSFDDGAKK